MVFFKKQKGFASILVALTVVFITLIVPLTVELVKQKQETRSKAAGECYSNYDCDPPETCQNGACTAPGGKHMGCSGNHCSLQDGAGSDECNTNEECGAPPPTPAPAVCSYRDYDECTSFGCTSCTACSDYTYRCAAGAPPVTRSCTRNDCPSCANGCDGTVRGDDKSECVCKIPVPTPISVCTDGKTECNVSGGVNYCENGQWYSRNANAKECIQPTPTPIVTLTVTPTPTPAISVSVPGGINTVGSTVPEETIKAQNEFLEKCKKDPAWCQEEMANASEDNKKLQAAAIVAVIASGGVLAAPALLPAAAGGYAAAGVPGAATMTAVEAASLLASAPTWVQFGLGGAGMVAMASACGNGNYASTECAAAITGLQVAQMAEQAANRANVIQAAQNDEGIVTGYYRITKGTGERPPSVEPYDFQRQAARMAANEDYDGAFRCLSDACLRAHYNSYLRPVVVYRGEEVAGQMLSNNGGVSGDILIAKTLKGVPRTQIQMIDAYGHELGHAYDFQRGMTGIQSEARQYYADSVFYAVLGNAEKSNFYYRLYVRFATGYYPP